jgi:hypothetical protein
METLLALFSASGVLGILPNVSLLLTPALLGIILLALLCAGIGIAAATRRHLARVTASSVATVVLLALFLAKSTLATPSSWQVLYAAYSASSPAEMTERRKAVADKWLPFHEEIRLLDWYLLANEWNVCHELWAQTRCTKAPSKREPQGIARELITNIAHAG